MERIEISKDVLLQPGDVIELHFKVFGPFWIKAAQLTLIEDRLAEKHPDYEVVSSQLEDNRYIVIVKIIEPPTVIQRQEAGVSPALIIAAIITVAGGLFLWLSLDKIYKITQTPAGKIGSISLAVIAAGIMLLLILPRK